MLTQKTNRKLITLRHKIVILRQYLPPHSVAKGLSQTRPQDTTKLLGFTDSNFGE